MPQLMPALAPVRAPSFENEPASSWSTHSEIAYRFARHVRHDMVNIQCTLQLFEVAQKLRDAGGPAAVPPELQPEALRLKVNASIQQLVGHANDLVLLSQATHRGAYTDPHTLTLGELLEGAIGQRITGDLPRPAFLVAPPSARVVVMGDMLAAALTPCFFQWSPWSTTCVRAAQATVRVADRSVVLRFPADDVEALAGMARRLNEQADDARHPVLRNILSVPTTELALWLARFIVHLHGGTLSIDANDPDLAVEVRLPTAG